MKIGYARISTREQNLHMQVIALENEGCEKIHEEIVSGVKSDRPVFDIVLKQLRDGDILVVWKLDRLGRSLKHLVELVQVLMDRNIGLCSRNFISREETFCYPDCQKIKYFQKYFI